jgi:hypothetical protein
MENKTMQTSLQTIKTHDYLLIQIANLIEFVSN